MCVCVCVRERERERERGSVHSIEHDFTAGIIMYYAITSASPEQPVHTWQPQL